MAVRLDPAIVTFASGVLSPKLRARSDIAQYEKGLLSSNNMMIIPHGALARRPGTYFVNEVKHSNLLTRLIPFDFSTEQTYMIEAGHQYFRFYANSGRLEDPPGTPVEIATPWLNDELADLRWAQTADVMYIVHPLYPPYKLTRTSATSFALTAVTFSAGRAPILSLNQNAANYVVSVAGAWGGPLTITMAANTFTAGDVGKTFYFKSASVKQAYYVSITGFTSATVVTASGLDRFSTTAGPPQGVDADRWAFGAFGATDGCAAVTFHEGRLVYGGFKAAPDMVWLSVSDDFDNFELTSPDPATVDAENDDKAIQRRAISSQVNSIRWLASGGASLAVGTSGAEFRLKPANDDILSPLSASLKRTTQRGAAAIPPVVIDNDIFYVDRSKAVLRQLTFDLLSDAEKAKDISLLAEHLMLPGVKEMVYQQAPIPTLWIVMNDGTFLGWAIEGDQEVLAAHPHALGGSIAGIGNGIVESIGVIPGANMGQNGSLEDQLWFVTAREINGVRLRYIERGTRCFRPNLQPHSTDLNYRTAAEEGFFVDSGLTLNEPITVTAITTPGFSLQAVVTAPAHGLANGDTVRFRGVRGAPDATDINDLFDQKRFTVSAVTANDFIPLDIVTGAPVNAYGLSLYTDASVYKEVSAVSGLDHLEGEEVAILADGKYHPPQVVSGGGVVLDFPASIVHVGFGYVSSAQTMPLVGTSGRGTDQGYPKSMGVTAVYVMDTVGGEYGYGEVPSHWEPMIFDNAGNLMDYGPRILTGVRTLKAPGSAVDHLPTIHVRQTQALPMTVLGYFPRVWGNSD